MKILFAAPENAWGGFLGMVRSELPQHQFVATGRFEVDTLKGFDVLIPTMAPVTEMLLRDCDRLRLIQQCGAGLEGVDIEAARELNIWVANVPTEVGNAHAVAELGIYMMIGLSRNVQAMAQSLAERKMGQPQGKDLKGRTVGIVGLGGIGRALVKRLRAFGVQLIAVKQENPEVAMKEFDLEWVGGAGDLDKLLSRSDFAVLCLPVTAATQSIMNRNSFSSMKKGAFLINLSRGGLIEYNALLEALSSGLIAGAGLDVFWEEPPDPDDPIFNYNVLATPHIAGSTDGSMQNIVRVVAENIRRAEKNEEPLYHQN
ncbi:2-hydroxyacid dehydrogenase [Thermodesulfobacteriota bacterium]